MSAPHNLSTECIYRGHPATIVSRCYADGCWLYGVRLARTNEVIDDLQERDFKVDAPT